MLEKFDKCGVRRGERERRREGEREKERGREREEPVLLLCAIMTRGGAAS